MKKNLLALCTALSLCAVGNAAHAQARITLVNLDGPNIGLNDPTPAAPIGGNPGRTLGQQRTIAYQYAMDTWGALLSSAVEIKVEASFAPLECVPGRIVLGQAAPISRTKASAVSAGGAADFEYPVALANALASRDLGVGSNDILTNFSSAIDTPSCQALGTQGWYYGLTGNAPFNTQERANFFNVIMHELGHGLGASGNSRFLGSLALRLAKSPWDGLAWSNTHSMSYNDFSVVDARMGVALTKPGQTVWKGRATNQMAALLAEKRELLSITAPVAGLHEFVPADFGSSDLSPLKGEIVLVSDAVGQGAVDTHLGCDGSDGQPAIANGPTLAGKVVLIDRGVCEFSRKALSAQNHGAVAVIIANNVPETPLLAGPGTAASQVAIPVITVTQEVGGLLRGEAAVVAAGFATDANRFYGLDSTQSMRLFTPATYQPGSSFSHVDSDMTPDFLMEPAESKSVRADVAIDVALEMFEEMGWPTNRSGTAKLGGCDTTVPVYRDSFIPGANLVAQNNLCKASSANNRSQQLRCMNDHISALYAQSLLTSLEVAKARQCVAKL
ncbi:PA domain-containing protein [Stenotrophomonas sp.]|uniref:PA domain-containing protein n=1 Tax=Stenotrophomonas sp. TaxID=69392 RepID=UPI0028AAC01D|nr:PA domain-containing protein [Stenotrophomonas sp.]